MRLLAREAITSTNKSPVFLIVTWVSQAAVLLAVAIKVLLLTTSIGLHQDDWCILVAAVLSIGQVVAVSFQGMYGIGKEQASLSDNDLLVYEKSGYAAQLLYTLTIEASKLSVVFFIYHITPFETYRRIAIGMGLFIILWGVASLFVTMFQCVSPDSWHIVRGTCIDQTAFWTSYAWINIATEIALIFVPFHLFYTIISDLTKKTVLMVCFSLRLIVVAAIGVQIYFTHHATIPTGDPHYKTSTLAKDRDVTFTTWPLFLTTQVVQSLSIITTCIPFMKSLFLGLESGMIQTGHVSTRNLSIAKRSGYSDASFRNPFSLTSLRSGLSNPSTHTDDHRFPRKPSIAWSIPNPPITRESTSRIPFRWSLRRPSGDGLERPAPRRLPSAYSRRRGPSARQEREDVSGAVRDADGTLHHYSAPQQRRRPVIDVDIPSGQISMPNLDVSGFHDWARNR